MAGRGVSGGRAATARPELRLPDGAELILVAGVEALYHLPGPGDESLDRKTLCGLTGPVYVYGAITRSRRCCSVCAARAPKGSLITVRKRGSKRPGKPRGKWGKMTEPQIRAVHIAHWEQRIPINELGRRYWERFGYASANACANSLGRFFKELELPRHDRIAMTVQASTKHGLARRRHPKAGGKFGNGAKTRGYKRWLANERAGGETRNPLCIATTARGKACTHRALNESVHCFVHEPDRQAAVAKRCAEMRKSSPLHDPTRIEPAGPLVALLREYRANGGGWRQLAGQTGIPEHWISHVAHGNQRNVDRDRASRIREALEPEVMAA